MSLVITPDNTRVTGSFMALAWWRLVPRNDPDWLKGVQCWKKGWHGLTINGILPEDYKAMKDWLKTRPGQHWLSPGWMREEYERSPENEDDYVEYQYKECEVWMEFEQELVFLTDWLADRPERTWFFLPVSMIEHAKEVLKGTGAWIFELKVGGVPHGCVVTPRTTKAVMLRLSIP